MKSWLMSFADNELPLPSLIVADSFNCPSILDSLKQLKLPYSLTTLSSLQDKLSPTFFEQIAASSVVQVIIADLFSDGQGAFWNSLGEYVGSHIALQNAGAEICAPTLPILVMNFDEKMPEGFSSLVENAAFAVNLIMITDQTESQLEVRKAGSPEREISISEYRQRASRFATMKISLFGSIESFVDPHKLIQA